MICTYDQLHECLQKGSSHIFLWFITKWYQIWAVTFNQIHLWKHTSKCKWNQCVWKWTKDFSYGLYSQFQHQNSKWRCCALCLLRSLLSAWTCCSSFKDSGFGIILLQIWLDLLCKCRSLMEIRLSPKHIFLSQILILRLIKACEDTFMQHNVLLVSSIHSSL